MKIFKLFFAVAAFVLSLGAQATDTRYDFSFTTLNGVVVSGAGFVYDGSTITSGWGTLTVDGSSYAMSNFVMDSSSPWKFDFDAGSVSYYANYTTGQRIGGSKYDGSLSYTPSEGTDIISGFVPPLLAPVVAVPEIDGSKLPQAALLILALVFMVRRLKAARPTPGFSTQFA